MMADGGGALAAVCWLVFVDAVKNRLLTVRERTEFC